MLSFLLSLAQATNVSLDECLLMAILGDRAITCLNKYRQNYAVYLFKGHHESCKEIHVGFMRPGDHVTNVVKQLLNPMLHLNITFVP